MSSMEQNKAGVHTEEVGKELQFSNKEGFTEMVTFEWSVKRNEEASHVDVQSRALWREQSVSAKALRQYQIWLLKDQSD